MGGNAKNFFIPKDVVLNWNNFAKNITTIEYIFYYFTNNETKNQ